MASKIRVGLLFGGRSGEHQVSLISAQGVLAAIDKDKYEVIPIGITPEGRWLTSGDVLQALQAGTPDEAQVAALLADPSQRGLLRLRDADPGVTRVQRTEIDVILPILHGPFGEDGTVQGLLELAGVPYAGAGVAASALGMDKVLFKDICQAHGLPIVPYRSYKRKAWEQDPEGVAQAAEDSLGYPCFVKPANLGSSVGISKAHNREGLQAALKEAARYDRKLLVEQAINAREIEVSVLGNDNPLVSVPGEIIPCNEFYDYSAKYLDGESELLIPAPLAPEQTAQVQALARQVYLAIDCAGMARVDMLLCRDTGTLYLNEVNTIPGFTPISMYPKLWEASGISYTELIDRLIQLGLERFEDKSRSETSYTPPSQE
jgi:D-alanine-D-alanine ligase